ncbi:MAG: DNA/RNA non-specific endonuclease [Ruminococcus sp.]|nr:DNA/RNA non-specific endonuclease [Ruminococcus sp.]
MMNMKDVSSDVTPAKVSEVKPVEAPKEIGENKSNYADAPKEIGESSAKVQDIPLEIGENNNLQPNTVYEVDGTKHYTDDNGEVYCVNSDLIPNNTYELNGYKYETDDIGRKISAEGKLQVKDHEGRGNINVDKSEIGKGYEKETDDRGHIIGDQFNGGGGVGNLVPQDHYENTSGGYWKLENQLAKEVSAGKDVYMRVDLDYPGSSYRPGSFLVSYSINGEEFVKVFSNDPRGEVK